MSVYMWLAIGLTASGFVAFRAVPIWIDGRRHEMRWAHRLRWALLGIVMPSRYWWGARIEAMPPQEQADLLARETDTMGLSRADSLRCPLCGGEAPHAWTLTAEGHPTVAQGPIKCPQCDFRLDACRHCVHFLPGLPRASGGLNLNADDIGSGRCGFYKTPQPVDQIASPEVAKQLKERGYESFNSPLPIVDSFVPPDFCRAFQPGKKRLQAGEVRWPDARRVALLRLLLPRPISKATAPEETVSGDEQWLL
jgi:hypothetical protein